MSSVVRQFWFWNFSAYLVAMVIAICLATHGTWSWVVIGYQASLITGLLVGRFVLDRS